MITKFDVKVVDFDVITTSFIKSLSIFTGDVQVYLSRDAVMMQINAAYKEGMSFTLTAYKDVNIIVMTATSENPFTVNNKPVQFSDITDSFIKTLEA